jgi:hypothetical protein
MMELAMMPIGPILLIGEKVRQFLETRQLRRRALTLFALSASVAPFAAFAADTASAPELPLIIIEQNSYTVLGKTVATAAELMALLKENKVTKVDVQYDDGADYKRIGGVIYGLARASIDSVHVNGRNVREEVCADKKASTPPGYCAR